MLTLIELRREVMVNLVWQPSIIHIFKHIKVAGNSFRMASL